MKIGIEPGLPDLDARNQESMWYVKPRENLNVIDRSLRQPGQFLLRLLESLSILTLQGAAGRINHEIFANPDRMTPEGYQGTFIHGHAPLQRIPVVESSFTFLRADFCKYSTRRADSVMTSCRDYCPIQRSRRSSE